MEAVICLFFLAGVQQRTESTAAASRGPYLSAVSHPSVFSQLQMSSFELIQQHLTAANALFLHLSASFWVSPREQQLNFAPNTQSGQSKRELESGTSEISKAICKLSHPTQAAKGNSGLSEGKKMKCPKAFCPHS